MPTKNPTTKATTFRPPRKPSVKSVRALGQLHDKESLTPEVLASWIALSKRPQYLESSLSELGVCHVLEVAGDLHIAGNFSTFDYGLIGLIVHGDLIVDGVYSDPDYPQTYVLIKGALRARTIVTGGGLEVHGPVNARHLAGFYNDYSALFASSVEATAFFPENHYFDLAKRPSFDLVIGEDARYRVPDKIGRELSILPNATVKSYLKSGLVDSNNELNTTRLYKHLRGGKEPLAIEPRDLDPELAIFAPSVREKMQAPQSITSVKLSDRNLRKLPEALFRCENLQRLILDGNQLTSTSWVDHFPKLVHLDLDDNPLAKLSPKLGKLSELKSLSLRYTRNLESIPSWISKLKNLRELWITLSPLKQFPVELAELPKLKKLWIWHYYDVSGAILSECLKTVDQMKLTHFGLLQGNLKKMPRNISALESIKHIKLDSFAGEERRRIEEALPLSTVKFL